MMDSAEGVRDIISFPSRRENSLLMRPFPEVITIFADSKK